jgi:hypothetical protein
MGYTSRAVMAAIAFAIPVAVFGQAQSLYITNYQLVSSAPAGSPTLYQLTYRADIGNLGVPWGSVTATVSTTNPIVVRTVHGNNVLTFPAVPANSQVTSTNTFAVLANPNVPLDFSQLVWTFQTTPQAPVANAGPAQTVTVGTAVPLTAAASTNPSGVGKLTYAWAFTSHPPGSSARLTASVGLLSGFTPDVPGNYVVSLTVSNGVNSSNTSVTFSTSNTPPVANAGPNQFVSIGALVHLNGTGSTDVDGNSLNYQWSFVSVPLHSTATLSDAAALLPTFTADLPGVYVVQLVVNDAHANSVPAMVTITTALPTMPTAYAGPNTTVQHNTNFTLQGSGVDPQGLPLQYKWTTLSEPSNDFFQLASPTIPQPTVFLDKPGAYVFQLVVTNGEQTSAPATVTITTTNTPPVANAGADQNAFVGRAVLLNGSGSTDSDHDTLVYAWNFAHVPAGSAAAISGAANEFPSFTPDIAGTYVVQLIVRDPYSSSVPVTSTITVTTPVTITLTPNPLAVSAAPVMMTVTLSAAAGSSGAVITLASSNTAAATVPATVTVQALASTATFVVTPGTVSGSTTINATSPTMASGTAVVNYTEPATILLSATPVNVPKGQQVPFPVNLSVAPPPTGGVLITLASSNVGEVKISPTTVVIQGGATAPTTQPVISGVNLGSVTITATATGYPTVTQTVNCVETVTFYPTTVSMPFTTSRRYTWLMLSGTAPAGGLTLNLTSDNPAVATVPATITIPAGATEVQLTPIGVSNGTTTIHASLPPLIPDSTFTVVIGQ